MAQYQESLDKTGEIGRIQSINQSVALVSGLPNASLDELVLTEKNKKGVVFSLGEKTAEVLMLEDGGMEIDQPLARTGKYFQVGVNSNLLGRIIDPLGEPVDGKAPIEGELEQRKFESRAPNITERKEVNRHLETGVTRVDLLTPLGHGQREAVLGDEKIGKTTFLLQTLANQAKRGRICIYVSIGKRAYDLKSAEKYLRKQDVFDQVVMLSANAGSSSAQIYMAPYSGMAIAEYFRDQGEDVVVVFDDLNTHAKIYREISLLLERPPGRKSYPGDIFHIHAKLLERAGNIENDKGEEVSITALPVVSTSENDISGYIPTNLMAMTDGHLFFDQEKFSEGTKPAINSTLSVSRVGNQTKRPLEQELAQKVKRRINEYKQASKVSRFGVELPESTQETLEFGEKLEAVLSQSPYSDIGREFQVVFVGLLFTEYWQKKTISEIEEEIQGLLEQYKKGEGGELKEKVKKAQHLEELKQSLEKYFSSKKRTP